MTVIDQRRLFQKIISHPLPLLVIGIVLTLAGGALGGMIDHFLFRISPDDIWLELLGACIYAATTAAAYCLFVRYIERRPVSELSLKNSGPELSMGIMVGFVAMTVTIAVIWLGGGYKVVGTQSALVLVPMLSIAITSGVGEEILLRGLVFRLLEKWLGSWASLGLSALLFGFLHIANPNSSVLAAVAISLEAGILLAAIYMVTRRLWAAIGLHAMWNFTQGGIFGAAVSGTEPHGVLVSQSQGSELLTGGGFGPEASIPAMIVCTGIGLYFLIRAWRDGQFHHASWHRFLTGEATPAA